MTGRCYVSSLNWVDCQSGMVPQNPVVGGNDVNGEPLYIGRAFHSGDTIPGKIVPSHQCCYVSWGGAEHSKRQQYQMLTNPNNVPLTWKSSTLGTSFIGAVLGGQQTDSTPLFIGNLIISFNFNFYFI